MLSDVEEGEEVDVVDIVEAGEGHGRLNPVAHGRVLHTRRDRVQCWQGT